MVLHWLAKPDLSGFPGSIPGVGVQESSIHLKLKFRMNENLEKIYFPGVGVQDLLSWCQCFSRGILFKT